MAEVQRTSRRQFIQQTRTRALGVDTSSGDRRLEIMQNLSQFAGAASEESQRAMRAEIETKKALGASRAAQDLLVAEQNRQGISDDDVKATQVAYNAVVGKHDTIQAGNQFIEWYQANPEADDAQISEMKQRLYKPLFEKYSGDDLSSKQISLQVQESQFNLMPVQEKIKQEHRQAKNQEAFRISIEDNLGVPDADISSLVDKELPTIAKQLGISEFDAKKLMLEEMRTRAEQGDGRLLKQLETTDWAKGLDVTKNARASYDKERAILDTTTLAKSMADNETKFLSGQMSERAFLRYVDNTNSQYGEYNPYNSSRVQSLLMQRTKALNKVDSDAEVVKRYAENKSKLPLGVSTQFGEDEKKVIIKTKEAYWANMTQSLLDKGEMSETEVNNKVLKDKVKWSMDEQIILPDLQAQVKSLLLFDPTVADQSETVTGRWEEGSKVLQAMPVALLSNYLGGDADYALAVKSNLETMRPLDAFQFAYNAQYKPRAITPTIRKEATNRVRAAIEDTYKAGIYSSWFEDAPSIPSGQRDVLVGQLESRAVELVKGGISDINRAAEFAVEEFSNSHTQLPNGTISNTTIGSLKTNMLRGSDVKELSDKQVVKYVDTFLKEYATTKSGYLGESISADTLQVQFSQDGSTFSLLDETGMQLDSGYLTTQMFDIARPEDLEETSRLIEKSYQDRKVQQKERKLYQERGFFY